MHKEIWSTKSCIVLHAVQNMNVRLVTTVSRINVGDCNNSAEVSDKDLTNGYCL